jgi:hypothetical protein
VKGGNCPLLFLSNKKEQHMGHNKKWLRLKEALHVKIRGEQRC